MFLPPALLAETWSSGLRQRGQAGCKSFSCDHEEGEAMHISKGSQSWISQDGEQARAAGHSFSPTLDKRLILTGSDLGQTEGGENPAERSCGSSLGKENPWQVCSGGGSQIPWAQHKPWESRTRKSVIFCESLETFQAGDGVETPGSAH